VVPAVAAADQPHQAGAGHRAEQHVLEQPGPALLSSTVNAVPT
jgi:hypothetical protein